MASNENRESAKLAEAKEVQCFEGIMRKTLAYNPDLMLCHFNMKKGARIPLHSHQAAQIGYTVKGSIRFFSPGRPDILAGAGSSYVFDSNQEHGGEVLADSEVIECFSPMRPDYV